MTARTSSGAMLTTSLGLGLPPAAAMSPPALCTSMSSRPKRLLDLSNNSLCRVGVVQRAENRKHGR